MPQAAQTMTMPQVAQTMTMRQVAQTTRKAVADPVSQARPASAQMAHSVGEATQRPLPDPGYWDREVQTARQTWSVPFLCQTPRDGRRCLSTRTARDCRTAL